MKRKSIVSFIIAGIMCATNAMAGPFGLDMGMTLKDIGGKSEKVANGKYILEVTTQGDTKRFFFEKKHHYFLID